MALASCEHDAYETGEGAYSFMRTDYVTVDVKAHKIASITTDEGRALNIPQGMDAETQKADTLLRWLLYYNQRNEGDVISMMGHNTMLLLKPFEASDLENMKTDPVKVTSVWLAPSMKYLNLRLGLMTGNATQPDDRQTVGMVLDKVEDGVAYYTLYHDQANIAQYYTQEVFLTMECPEQKVIDLTIQTYNGIWHKQFQIENRNKE